MFTDDTNNDTGMGAGADDAMPAAAPAEGGDTAPAADMPAAAPADEGAMPAAGGEESTM